MALLFERLMHRINQLAGALAGVLIVYMVGHILLEIVLRFFSESTYVLDEFIGYAVATMTFLGLGYALSQDGLIRVTLLLERLPKPIAHGLDILTTLATLAAFGFFTWYWSISVIRSFDRNTVSQTMAETPLWIPQGMVLVGMIVFCLTLLSRLLVLCTQGAKHG